jgi:protein-S-isoprenylcysteine O-methyltransferase Ste14
MMGTQAEDVRGRHPGTLRELVGAGDKIGLVTLPFLAVGLGLNIAYPSAFSVGGPPGWLRVLSIVVLIPGVVLWLWSVALILTKVPRRDLITTGPFALVKHPLYTFVPLLVLPWAGFLLDSWLGAALGIVMYVAGRRFARLEEAELAGTFGERWERYRRDVLIPWL